MRSIKDDMYDEAFRLWDMVPAGTVPGYGSAGSVYRFANGCGHGEYWAYFHDNLFAVNAFDMTFEHAGVMRYRHAEHLSIGYYEAADLIVQSGGSTLRAGAISTYLAEEGAEYVALYQPGSATRATSITISPDYYRDYLQARFGNIPPWPRRSRWSSNARRPSRRSAPKGARRRCRRRIARPSTT